MITKKVGRALPRMAVASLALGGPAIMAGCGKSSDPVKDYCKKIANCYDHGSGYVDACVAYHNNELSYYDAACRSAVRKALDCAAHQLSCDDIYYGYAGPCLDEYAAAADACGFYYYY